jgi:hypothetical protein
MRNVGVFEKPNILWATKVAPLHLFTFLLEYEWKWILQETSHIQQHYYAYFCQELI